MSKNKNPSPITDKLSTVALQAGLLLMTAAATLGMVEMPDNPNKVVLLQQPAFAVAADANRNDPNPLRREREETAPHYVSYSTIQRTPSRTGRM